METTIQLGFPELLARVGAIPPRHGRGKWTCPDCQRPALSVNPDKGVFLCHHAGCDFRGGIGVLRQRLGIAREWLPKPEYIRQMRGRELADRAARALYGVVRARRFKLLDTLHNFNWLEFLAHDAGADNPETWESLALVYGERPLILAELAILENANAADLLQFLSEDRATRVNGMEGVSEE